MAGLATLFDRRNMIEALVVKRPPKAFLRNTFFRNVRTFDTTKVDIDIFKGKQRAAAFVSPRQEGQVVGRTGYSTKTYEPLELRPKIPTTAGDALKRQPGEIVYSGNQNAMDRASMLLMQDMDELDNLIARREEIMCSQALMSDAVKIVDQEGNTLIADISFGRAADHTLSTGDVTSSYGGLWSSSTASPMETLRKMQRKIALDSGILPTVVVMGADAVDAFVSHPDVRDVGKMYNQQLQDIQMRFPNFQADGARLVGIFEGIVVFEYVEQYLDDWTSPSSPALTPMIGAKKILFGAPEARSEMLYGVIAHMKAGLQAMPRFVNTYEEEDPSVRWLQMHSRPLPSPHQVDAYMVASVLS